MNPKKPRSLKVLSGTDQRCRREAEEPTEAPPFTIGEALDEFPKPPQWLDVDGAELWNRYGRALHAAGILRDLDLPLLEVLCVSWSQFRRDAKAGRAPVPAERSRLLAELRELGMSAGARRMLAASMVKTPPASSPLPAGPAVANRFDRFKSGSRGKS